MKNPPILTTIVLLLGGLAVWALTLWVIDLSSKPAPGSGGGSFDPIRGVSGLADQDPGDPLADPKAANPPEKPTTIGNKTPRLGYGPSWNSKNPWLETRGLGRRTPPPAKGAVLFPDGTWLPVLNGVDDAPPFPGFAKGYPYAPVVQIVTADDGLQWYIHADGTRSAPQNMKYGERGKDLGTRAGWAVGNPYEKKPVLGSDGKVRYEPRKTGKPQIRTGPGG